VEELGPPVNLLSAAQLRFLARIRGLRPGAELHWRGDARGWSLDVAQSRRDMPPKRLLTARLDRDGTVRTKWNWL
jgi:hypothetical protein